MINDLKIPNPISELIEDEIYESLYKEGLLSEIGIRNYLIQTKFHQLKNQNFSSSEAISQIKQEYPNLEYDTINKIVYKKNKSYIE